MSTGALLAAQRFEGFVNGISGLRRKMLDRTTCHEPLHAAESYWEGRGPTGNSFEAESAVADEEPGFRAALIGETPSKLHSLGT
jgi:hypothetical protein